MDTSFFKSQASRLGLYLSRKQHVDLSRSALLEAIAAVHGAKDWNTLCASPTHSATLNLGTFSSRFRSSPVSMSLNRAPFSTLLMRVGGQDGSLAFLTHLARQHAQQGGQFIWLSTRFGIQDARNLIHGCPEVAEISPDSIEFLVPRLQESERINLSVDADAFREWFSLMVSSGRASFPHAKYCKILLRTLQPVLEIRPFGTSAPLLTAFEYPSAIPDLIAQTATHWPQRQVLEDLMTSCHDEQCVPVDMTRVARDFTTWFNELSSDGLKDAFFSGYTGLNLAHSIEKGKHVVVGMGSRFNGLDFMPLFLSAITSVMFQHTLSLRRRDIPLLIILDDILSPNTNSQIIRLVSQSRSFETSILVSQEISSEQDNIPAPLMSNTVTRMVFDRDDGHYWLHRLGYDKQPKLIRSPAASSD